MSLKHFQFSGITKPGHDKQRPAKSPKDRDKKNLITQKSLISLIKINKTKVQLYREIVNKLYPLSFWRMFNL